MENEKQPIEDVSDEKDRSDRTQKTKRSKKMQVTSILLVLFMLATTALGGFSFVVNSNARNQKKADTEKLEKLEKEKSELAQKLKAAMAASSAKSTDTTTAPSASALENIQAAISSENYAALEGYMADTVNVILAASEGLGERTPTQAIADMAYLNNGTAPWDFDLPAATISSWTTGDYRNYISADGLIGESANNYVVAFMFDSAGKISDVFMSANSELM